MEKYKLSQPKVKNQPQPDPIHTKTHASFQSESVLGRSFVLNFYSSDLNFRIWGGWGKVKVWKKLFLTQLDGVNLQGTPAQWRFWS